MNADISLLLASAGVPVSLSGAPVTLADVAAVAGVSVPGYYADHVIRRLDRLERLLDQP